MGKQLSLLTETHGHDPDEAPKGFYAVPKTLAISETNGANICRACDWRTQCNDPNTDLLASGHRCMGYAVISERDGSTYQRDDKASVVFKKRY